MAGYSSPEPAGAGIFVVRPSELKFSAGKLGTPSGSRALFPGFVGIICQGSKSWVEHPQLTLKCQIRWGSGGFFQEKYSQNIPFCLSLVLPLSHPGTGLEKAEKLGIWEFPDGQNPSLAWEYRCGEQDIP